MCLRKTLVSHCLFQQHVWMTPNQPHEQYKRVLAVLFFEGAGIGCNIVTSWIIDVFVTQALKGSRRHQWHSDVQGKLRCCCMCHAFFIYLWSRSWEKKCNSQEKQANQPCVEAKIIRLICLYNTVYSLAEIRLLDFFYSMYINSGAQGRLYILISLACLSYCQADMLLMSSFIL